MTRQRLETLVAVIALSSLAAACAPKEREKPVPTSPIGNELTTVRKQLEGTWGLVEAVVHQPGAKPEKVGARGTLIYDAYGNLEINGTVTDPAWAKAVGSVLTAKGRAVIDVANQRLVFQDIEGNLKDAAPVSPDKARRYEFEGDLLRLTSLDAAGNVTAVTTWKRR
jgi:hypothetical protein